MEIKNVQEFWDSKYQSNKIGWDLGAVSTPLKNYFDQISSKELRILIPGSGNAWEAEYLLEHGFKNVHIIDISSLAVESFRKRVPQFPKSKIFTQNFFDHNEKYDLIIEQTFFCALSPSLRKDYVKHMHSCLNNNGKLVGLLFNIPLNTDHPPFGGSKPEYIELFTPYFNVDCMEPSINSIAPRQGNELFVNFSKK